TLSMSSGSSACTRVSPSTRSDFPAPFFPTRTVRQPPSSRRQGLEEGGPPATAFDVKALELGSRDALDRRLLPLVLARKSEEPKPVDTEIRGAEPAYSPAMNVGVMGAGAIGCYLGGRLLASGVPAVLVGRASVAAEVAEHGLRLTDYRGFDR